MTLFLWMKCTYSVSQDICQAAVHKGLTISGIHSVTQLKKVFVLWTKKASPTSYYTVTQDLLMTEDNNYGCHQGVETVQVMDSQMSFLVLLEKGFTREFRAFYTCN